MGPSDELPRERPKGPADERIAGAYAEGYGEGIRDALREVLQAVRSSTPQELRWQVQSRLARVAEEVELKRRSLLGPPPRDGWQPARARAVPAIASAPSGPRLTESLEGGGVLFREARPSAAPEHVGAVWPQYGRVVVFGRPAEPPLPVPPESIRLLAVGRMRAGDDAEAAPDLSAAAGRLPAILSEGPLLVYCDCLEYLAQEYTEEIAVRSIGWIVDRVRERAGWVVVTVNPDGLKPSNLASLQKIFRTVR